MSTAKITEGGTPRVFSQVFKLKTNLQGGGTCLWVPEDERVLHSKHISKNGSYTAEEEGYYGYDEVSVQVPNAGSVSGVDSNGTPYSVSVDPETGNLVTTELPYSIQIDTLPNKLQYTEGESLDYTGIVVKAYKKNGELWTEEGYTGGVIPNDELTLPTTIAHGGGSGLISPFDLSPLPSPLQYADQTIVNEYTYRASNHTYFERYTFTPAQGKMVRFFIFGISSDDGLLRTFFASDTSGVLGVLSRYRTKDGVVDQERTHDETLYANRSYTHGNKEVHYFDGTNESIGTTTYIDVSALGAPYYTYPNNTASKDEVAWTLIYGTVDTSQQVPVQWNRPQDYKLLDDYFEISVSEASNV